MQRGEDGWQLVLQTQGALTALKTQRAPRGTGDGIASGALSFMPTRGDGAQRRSSWGEVRRAALWCVLRAQLVLHTKSLTSKNSLPDWLLAPL